MTYIANVDVRHCYRNQQLTALLPISTKVAPENRKKGSWKGSNTTIGLILQVSSHSCKCQVCASVYVCVCLGVCVGACMYIMMQAYMYARMSGCVCVYVCVGF